MSYASFNTRWFIREERRKTEFCITESVFIFWTFLYLNETMWDVYRRNVCWVDCWLFYKGFIYKYVAYNCTYVQYLSECTYSEVAGQPAETSGSLCPAKNKANKCLFFFFQNDELSLLSSVTTCNPSSHRRTWRFRQQWISLREQCAICEWISSFSASVLLCAYNTMSSAYIWTYLNVLIANY